MRYALVAAVARSASWGKDTVGLVKCEECERQEPELPLYLAFERIFLYQRNFLLK